MISQALAGGAPAPAPAAARVPAVTAEQPDGDFIDIVMLQFHVAMASLWLILAVVVAFMAVPRLRRVPSALGLHSLQVKRVGILSALWGFYLMALSTGIYLLFQQTAYDPPLSGEDWDKLPELPYAVPYYYALYGKIILFAVMGLASYVLAREAKKASSESEAGGGPVEEDIHADDFLDEQQYGSYGSTKLTTYAVAERMAAKKTPKRTVHVVPLWISIIVMVVGTVGIAFCVTLIKYFHELSKSAVVYEILKITG